ncbi:hypothetical protein Ancab_031413 [Ancistrocladus abbreviatus]
MSFKLACAVFICMAVAAPLVEAAISCDVVVARLSVCDLALFLHMSGGPLLAECCSNVRYLLSLPKSQADRQALCNCTITHDHKINVDWAAASKIPEVCHQPVYFPISPNTNCSKY